LRQNDKPSERDLAQLDAKKLRRILRVLTVVLIVSGVVGALFGVYKRFNPDLPYVQALENSESLTSVVRHIRINGVDLWVPVAYFKTMIPPPGEQDAALLITLHPEFEPLKESQARIWEKGEWHRHVMILILSLSGKKTINELFTSLSQAFDATELQGIEYGLNAYSQPKGIVNARELWLEGDESAPVSLIVCSKQEGETSHPQCTHYIKHAQLEYNISYDKKLLPHWREIRDKTNDLISRFKLPPPSESSTHNSNKGD
jgi:hypothetical protein